MEILKRAKSKVLYTFILFTLYHHIIHVLYVRFPFFTVFVVMGFFIRGIFMSGLLKKYMYVKEIAGNGMMEGRMLSFLMKFIE